MATLTKKQLFHKIVESIYECGWSVLYISDVSLHPFRIRIYNQEESHALKIYIWNLSYGGAPRKRDEYRIQLKVRGHLQHEIGWKTLILGWWNDGEVFSGFDFEKHKGTPGYSSSIQIKEETLRKAYLNGMSAYDKGNNEIAIAFRTDFFVEYVRNLEQLHAFGESAQDFEVLAEVTDNPTELNTGIIEKVSPPRQITVTTISKKLRDTSFRKRVLTAYGYRCAFCDLQLNLVDGAHIVPVSDNSSTDETCNGVALCALHHRAYDTSFVTFNEKYEIIYNQVQMRRLRKIGHDSGGDKFISDLRRLIHVPPSVNDRPHESYIISANKLRGWTGQ